MQSISEEEERDGRSSPLMRARFDQLQVSAAPHAQTGSAGDNGAPPSIPKCHKWLEEIETDVLRTCPGDKSAVEDAADEFDAALSQEDSAEVGDGAFSSSTRVRFSMTDTSFGDSSGGAVVEMSPVVAAQGVASTEGDLVPALAVGPNSSGAEVLSGEGEGGLSGKKLGNTGGGTRDKLRRVLRAFAVYNRRVSYCQVCAKGRPFCGFFSWPYARVALLPFWYSTERFLAARRSLSTLTFLFFAAPRLFRCSTVSTLR